MPEYQIEMLWKCPCGHENRGQDKVCSGEGSCGRPKTDADAFYMPGDTSPAAAVTDAEELRHARAGADWSCRYCQSSQRKLDGTCAVCGASQEDTAAHGSPVSPEIDALLASPPPPTPSLEAMAGEPSRSRPQHGRDLGAVFLALAAVLLVGMLGWLLFRKRIVEVHVSAMSWTHAVIIDRYSVYHRDGFSPEAGAFHIVPLGERYHHTDHVLVGHHEEHYTDRQACGQICTPVPRTCRTTPRNCSSNKNGYATCTGGDLVCTGGGQSCTTKYCPVDKIRSVPDYQDIPRTQMYYGWDAWDWGYSRTVRTAGAAPDTPGPLPWPTAEALSPPSPLAEGERERERREESYAVTFQADKGETTYPYRAADEAAFRTFHVGDHHKLRVSLASGVEVLQSGDY